MSDSRWLTDYHAWPAKTRVWAPVAAIIAFLLFLLLGWGWFQALVIGLLALVAVVWFTRDTTSDLRIGSAPPPPVRPASTPAPAPAPAPRPAPQAAAPVAPAAEATELGDSAASARVRAAARAAGEAARLMDAPVDAARPEGLAGPRGGVADDLKQIKGVGPKIEAMLHGLGYYHLDQIAAWGPAEVAWVDSHLEGFNGRVTRDGWVAQAALLAAGNTTEFSERVARGEVYDD